ncbi:hypothetical protein HJFPF1_03608 [Paramyrothecium foliicola]|nr:hypothetical protein HJFPF1_03608 [Paramyrothecium foliicola]
METARPCEATILEAAIDQTPEQSHLLQGDFQAGDLQIEALCRTLFAHKRFNAGEIHYNIRKITDIWGFLSNYDDLMCGKTRKWWGFDQIRARWADGEFESGGPQRRAASAGWIGLGLCGGRPAQIARQPTLNDIAYFRNGV